MLAMSVKDPAMKPSKSILDRSFVYVPSTATSVDQTWRRFGWRPSARTNVEQEYPPRPTPSAQPMSVRQ
jgi:hypothetical protein